jgi:hypothetical protein
MSEFTTMKQCPGNNRIPVKKSWYVPNGQDATYCRYCVVKKCNGIKEKRCHLVERVNASCACTEDQKEHWKFDMEPVVCDGCKKRAFGSATEAVCGGCGITNIDMADQLCRYCSAMKRRCYGCGTDETRWQKFQKQYGASDAQRAKFEAGTLTEADFPNLHYLVLRNALAYQRGQESLGWE